MNLQSTQWRWMGVGLACLAWASVAAAETAVVVYGRDLAPYREVEAGFKADGRFQTRVFNLQFNSQDEILRSAADGASVALVIGPDAIQTLKSSAWPVKTLFALTVTKPESAHFTSGVLLTIPVKKQLEGLRTLLPKAKTVVMVYDPAYSAPLMTEMRDQAPAAGFILNTGVVSSPLEINSALTKIASGGVDAILMVVDQTTGQAASVETLIRFGLEKKIPVIGQSIFHAKAGAVAALGIDFQDIGRQAAALAGQALPAGSSEIVEYPRKVALFVNATTATQINRQDLLQIPGAVRVE